MALCASLPPLFETENPALEFEITVTTLRATVRLLGMTMATVGSYVLLVLLLPLRRWAPPRHLRWRNAVFRRWGRGMLWILGARVRVEGSPPQGSFFLVANHTSYVDIFLLGSRVEAAFVAKADLRGWPIVGKILAAADTIFIDRGLRSDVVRVMDLIHRDLARGLGVVLFPEGTSGKGDVLLPFKPSLLQLPARDQLPVSFASLHYQTRPGAPPAHQVVCWWGDASFSPHLWQLLRLDGFEATLRFGAAPVAANDRKELATRLHAGIGEIFEPME